VHGDELVFVKTNANASLPAPDDVWPVLAVSWVCAHWGSPPEPDGAAVGMVVMAAEVVVVVDAGVVTSVLVVLLDWVPAPSCVLLRQADTSSMTAANATTMRTKRLMRG
jgi:hypothetical protein